MLLPELNRKDLEDIPAVALDGMRFEFLKTVDNALALALESEASGDVPPPERMAASPPA